MRTLKYLFYACLLLLSAAGAASCAIPAEQEQAEPDTPTVYYNDYLGLSITVPQGWQINALSANLSLSQGETGTPLLIEYADGSSRMELIDIQSRTQSSSAEHSRFCAYAELFPEQVELNQYVELLVKLLGADNSGYTYNIQKREQLPLARHTAERICMQVSRSNRQQENSGQPDSAQTGNTWDEAEPTNTKLPGDEQANAGQNSTQQANTPQADAAGQFYEQNYTEEYCIIALGKAVIVFYINYWPQNDISRAAAFSILEHITLPAPQTEPQPN